MPLARGRARRLGRHVRICTNRRICIFHAETDDKRVEAEKMNRREKNSREIGLVGWFAGMLRGFRQSWGASHLVRAPLLEVIDGEL